MSNSFIMTESIVRPAKMPYGRLKDNGFVGIEGEHAARALVVETKDDLSAFASVNLIIDDLDCGAMTKTTSGGTTTLSMTLTSSMIGRSGRKICQLIMVNSGNTVVQKSSQFEAYVGRANEIERSVDDGVTIIILSEAVTEMAHEAAAAAAQEAAADIVDDCQAIADAASASADAAAQSASDAQTAAASIVVDSALDATSTHALQNKVVTSEINALKADLGDLSELETTAKTNLVAAINEAAQSGGSGSGDGLSLAQRQTLINFVNSVGASFTTANAQSVIDAFNTAWNISVTGISLNKSTLTFSGYGLETLEATLSPVGAVGTITWLSSDTSVATVTSNGTVEALGNGTCTITATCSGYAATCSVTVSGIVAIYTVTNGLTGCSTNNGTTRVNHGSSYSATISIDIGYVSPFASASITMGGTDITSTAWSNGSISIAEVTGDVVITVAATQDPRELLYAWDFKTSLVDSVNGIEFNLINSNSGESVPTRDSNGLHFTAAEQVAKASISGISWHRSEGRSYELDIASASFAGDSGKHKRLLMLNSLGILIFRNTNGLQIYPGSWKQYTAETGKTIPATPDDLSGKTIKVFLPSDLSAKLYIDGDLIGTCSGVNTGQGVITGDKSFCIGGNPSGTGADGNQIYNMTITGFRVYQEEAVTS